MLSRSGYGVEDRPVNVPAHRAELNELGYLSVPLIVVAGRAFPGFPLQRLAVDLGLARARFSAAGTRRALRQALDGLQSFAELLPELPPALWKEQAYPLNPERDHTFGHFAWSVFRFLELTLEAPARGALAWEDLQESVQLTDWRSASRFGSFSDVESYAFPLLARGRAWGASISAEEMRTPITTPWGRLQLHLLVGILAEHTEIKRAHLLFRLRGSPVGSPRPVSLK